MRDLDEISVLTDKDIEIRIPAPTFGKRNDKSKAVFIVDRNEPFLHKRSIEPRFHFHALGRFDNYVIRPTGIKHHCTVDDRGIRLRKHVGKRLSVTLQRIGIVCKIKSAQIEAVAGESFYPAL